MKQLKFFALALTLLMGISLTSCFNDEDDPIVKMSLLARYDGGYYGASFTTVDGVRLIPADQSVMLTLTEGLYSIYFQYNRDEVPEGAKEITITLLSDPARLDKLYTSPEMGTGVSNAPLYAFEYSYNSGYGEAVVCPMLYDKTTMVYPAMFWRATVADEDAYEEELAKHQFTVTYEVKPAEPTVLYLYVNHNVTDEAGEVVKRTMNNVVTYELNIQAGVAAIESAGQKMSKIIMIGKCNSSSDNMEGAQEARFEIDCSKYNFD